MERPKTALPCCEAGRRYIYLGYDFTYGPNLDDTVENYLAHVRSVPPRWLVRVGEPKTAEEYRAPYVPPIAVVCPFCATAVPAVILREDPPDKLRIIIDGGYRCVTCKERLDSCDCARPADLWRIAR